MKLKLMTAALALFATMYTKAQRSEVFAPGGIAIKGYDAVAFFKESKPVRGVDSLSTQYKDAQWLFSSRTNLEAFKINPEKYAPQYGGYCAYGASEGHKASTETETWTIINGKLYFNYNTKVKGMWMKNKATLIEKADKQWSLIKDKP